MKIVAVDPESPLFGRIRPGYTIESINDRPVLDSIDFRFRLADERVRIKFADPRGRVTDFSVDHDYCGDLGLTLDDGRINVCRNDCLFCFVRQQPKGMRQSLYLKDEDYRLSFTHGNFITLSNTTDEDIQRIIEQRLSPLYVSVHATDDSLRRCIFRNEKLAPIMPLLRHLTDHSITIHTQVVLCPEVNDGPAFEQTVDELAGLYPGVESLAVVPVGLTKYRQNLPDLRVCTADEAGEIIDCIERRQREFLNRLGTRFVWPADEFYVEAKRNFPKHSEYEEMPQFENGVGMAREFITNFNRRRRGLKPGPIDKRLLFLTGHSAYPFLSSEIMPWLNDRLNYNIALQPVINRFWGSTVTVSGLLTGQDLLRQARAEADRFDTVVLPPNCLNEDDLFLDNLSLTQFRDALNREVVVGTYNLAETLRGVVA